MCFLCCSATSSSSSSSNARAAAVVMETSTMTSASTASVSVSTKCTICRAIYRSVIVASLLIIVLAISAHLLAFRFPRVFNAIERNVLNIETKIFQNQRGEEELKGLSGEERGQEVNFIHNPPSSPVSTMTTFSTLKDHQFMKYQKKKNFRIEIKGRHSIVQELLQRISYLDETGVCPYLQRCRFFDHPSPEKAADIVLFHFDNQFVEDRLKAETFNNAVDKSKVKEVNLTGKGRRNSTNHSTSTRRRKKKKKKKTLYGLLMPEPLIGRTNFSSHSSMPSRAYDMTNEVQRAILDTLKDDEDESGGGYEDEEKRRYFVISFHPDSNIEMSKVVRVRRARKKKRKKWKQQNGNEEQKGQTFRHHKEYEARSKSNNDGYSINQTFTTEEEKKSPAFILDLSYDDNLRSNEYSQSRREDYISALRTHIDIDSLVITNHHSSTSHHLPSDEGYFEGDVRMEKEENSGGISGTKRRSKFSCAENVEECLKRIEFSGDYLFVLVFEKYLCQHFQSELLWKLLETTTDIVPIVFGGVDHFANPELFLEQNGEIHRHLFIDALNYTPKNLAYYLRYLKENPRHLQKYLTWRKESFSLWHLEWPCELCRRLLFNPQPQQQISSNRRKKKNADLTKASKSLDEMLTNNDYSPSALGEILRPKCTSWPELDFTKGY